MSKIARGILYSVSEDDIDEDGLFTWPSMIDKIYDYAFSGLKKLRKIIMPDTIIDMGQKVFAECNHLESVQLSKDILVFNANNFIGCERLTELVIGHEIDSMTVKLIFYHCPELQKIVIKDKKYQISNQEHCLQQKKQQITSIFKKDFTLTELEMELISMQANLEIEQRKFEGLRNGVICYPKKSPHFNLKEALELDEILFQEKNRNKNKKEPEDSGF